MVKKATQADYRAKWYLGVLQTSGTTYVRTEQGSKPRSFAPGSFSAGEDLKDLKCVIKPSLWFKTSLCPAGGSVGTDTEGWEPHPRCQHSSTLILEMLNIPGMCCHCSCESGAGSVVLKTPKAPTQLWEKKVLWRNSGHVSVPL